MYYNSIIETIGNTPLVKLNKVNKGIPGTILVKVEYFNPGNSMKDRMAIKMVEDAEKEGKLKPGGTIIEGTSGNTGMGLALAAISKGYKCVFTLADKQSKEKMDILRAMGAEVIVCPTNVSPDDPRSYYSVAKKFMRKLLILSILISMIICLTQGHIMKQLDLKFGNKQKVKSPIGLLVLVQVVLCAVPQDI